MITVKLFAFYRDGRGKELQMDENEYSTPLAICHALNIEPEGVGILLVNGFHAKFDKTLTHGDLVSLYPPVAGG